MKGHSITPKICEKLVWCFLNLTELFNHGLVYSEGGIILQVKKSAYLLFSGTPFTTLSLQTLVHFNMNLQTQQLWTCNLYQLCIFNLQLYFLYIFFKLKVLYLLLKCTVNYFVLFKWVISAFLLTTNRSRTGPFLPFISSKGGGGRPMRPP